MCFFKKIFSLRKDIAIYEEEGLHMVTKYANLEDDLNKMLEKTKEVQQLLNSDENIRKKINENSAAVEIKVKKYSSCINLLFIISNVSINFSFPKILLKKYGKNFEKCEKLFEDKLQTLSSNFKKSLPHDDKMKLFESIITITNQVIFGLPRIKSIALKGLLINL